ncbi:MAG: hypothetical protein A2746_02115 [Candidatus Yanofskybacteria bacterium RIFCSPHIGHO2_01_FULL_44_22]|uniref:Uncharacterized protein n=1 Tax=Candidatus Yanofskybacteria bacterium RIFCSPHIGHO2_01_FULL_44_22 TaxID=1802669 RepID=A0A1F8EUG7_9BACT|nr:MAG: hypothetical protein A2746_02115 [Candidatus Yanofskybacteria bacterium RIFCSPHIGHO2_01_FULL_44_22]
MKSTLDIIGFISRFISVSGSILVVGLLVYGLLFITKPPKGPVFTSNPGQINYSEGIKAVSIFFVGTSLKYTREIVFADNYGRRIYFESLCNNYDDYDGIYEGLKCRIQYQEVWNVEIFPWWNIANAYHHRQWRLVGVQKLEE